MRLKPYLHSSAGCCRGDHKSSAPARRVSTRTLALLQRRGLFLLAARWGPSARRPALHSSPLGLIRDPLCLSIGGYDGLQADWIAYTRSGDGWTVSEQSKPTPYAIFSLACRSSQTSCSSTITLAAISVGHHRACCCRRRPSSPTCAASAPQAHHFAVGLKSGSRG